MPKQSTKERSRDPSNTGFYVEIPKALKAEFDQMFPGKGAKRALVIEAIRAVIQQEKDARHP